jgi:hypothetical protein
LGVGKKKKKNPNVQKNVHQVFNTKLGNALKKFRRKTG